MVVTPSLTSSPTSVSPWLDALDASSVRLREVVGELTEQQLAQPSFASGWNLGQVLSHLGSGAEICTALVERGLSGRGEGPKREELIPVWERWDALSPAAQRDQWLVADARHRGLLRSVGTAQAETLRVPYFAGPLTLAEYAGYRLSEQSVHGWDVEAATDPAAAIPSSEAGLLWERIDLVATRFHDGAVRERLRPKEFTILVEDLSRTFTLRLAAELHVTSGGPASPSGTIAGAADAVLRLIYGRYRSDADKVDVTGAVRLDDLVELFPGY